MSDATAWPAEHLSVRLNGQPCGALWQAQGRMCFAYAPAWLNTPQAALISQSLPLQAMPFEGPEVESFFGNLLPEGDVRTAVTRALRISRENDYALLDAIGGDCAGALSLERPDAPTAGAPSHQGKVLSETEWVQLAQDLPQRPLWVGEAGLRISLAGAQTKLALCKAGNDWMKPAPGGVTTHIIKPPIPGLDGSVENEVFCMTLARRCGLEVPHCWSETTPVMYVVERYDRRRNLVSSKLERLHQEDFCQALGLPASRKYESEGGPGIKDCFALVSRVCSDPVKDRLRLLQWVLFNFFIGNHDTHAKNLSLLYDAGKVRLAPFYDLISTAVYAHLDEKFAMKIGGAKSPRYLTLRHWDQLADECQLSKAFVRAELIKMAATILEHTQPLLHELAVHRPLTFKNVNLCLDRSRLVTAWLEAEKPQAKLPLGEGSSAHERALANRK